MNDNVFTEMRKTDCIDVELCWQCFTLPCECTIIMSKYNKGEVIIVL